MPQLTESQIQLIKKFQKDEITGFILYRKLARKTKLGENKDILQLMSHDEELHYKYYKSLSGQDVKPKRFLVFIVNLMASVFGLTFGVKLMENAEVDAQHAYTELDSIPDIKKIIEDEERHEKQLLDMIQEDRLQYMGSVVLGLNDALVELTGALAGLTLALQNPSLIALTGLITGIAAAFSMAASEYLSTKSEETSRDALKASVYTGIAYLFTVAILILPFLLLHHIYLSLSLTLIAAILIIASFNYYYAVVKDEKFTHRFGEMAILSMGVALLSFGVGWALRHFFQIDI